MIPEGLRLVYIYDGVDLGTNSDKTQTSLCRYQKAKKEQVILKPNNELSNLYQKNG